MATTVSRASQTGQSSAVSGGTIPTALFIPADVPDWTKSKDRTDAPFLAMIGRGQPLAKPNPTRSWGWGSKDPISDTLNAAVSDTTGTTITLSNQDYFSVGDRILIDSEEMRITAFPSTTTATVVRGFASTTAATHSNAATIIIIGPVIAENADDPASVTTQGETQSNYFQICTFTWTFSKRAQVTPTYEHRQGGRDQAELRKKMNETAPLRMELTLLLGQQAQGSSTSPSAMGGIRQSAHITTRYNVSSAALTEVTFNDQLQVVHNLVGPKMMPRTVICSPFMARAIGSWFVDRRRANDGTKFNSGVVRTVETWFGEMKIVPHYLFTTIANNRVYVIREDDISLVPYASSTGWQTGELSTQGWYRKGYLRGDFSSVWLNPDARLEYHTCSVTSGDYAGMA